MSQALTAEQVRQLVGITEEQHKYMKCWSVDDYRRISPGEICVDMFLEALNDVCPNHQKHRLVDIGCGTGRGGFKIWNETGMDVTLMDFAANCLDEPIAEEVQKQADEDAPSLRFVEHDLTQKYPDSFEWGYCCDVMEHLPPDQVDAALDSIFSMCSEVFFQIATIPDHFGSHPDIQDDLHLTVWDYNKWLKKFADYQCTIHRSLQTKTHVIFFVSGYTGSFSYDKMKMNTSPEIVWKNMRENFSLGLKQLRPFDEQADQKVVILAGGPSLNQYVDEIKEHKKNGAKIVTLNNTYNWAREHDLWPVNQFMLDARPFNKRFVEPVDEQNTYFMCSQVDHEIVKSLPPDKTWLFQGNLDDASVAICNELLGKQYEDWFPVCGGSTVFLRALPALFMMGFRDIEVYGLDSCLMGRPVVDVVDLNRNVLNGVDYAQHHAYEQKENDIDPDAKTVAIVGVAGKRFAVEGWMFSQAKEFIEFRRRLLHGLNIKVHGQGLIAHCLEQGLDELGDSEVVNLEEK